MSTSLVTLMFAVVLTAGPNPQPETPRKPHPLFPSLIELTDDEEEKLDQIIDTFIDYDSGKLKGPEGKRSATELQRLGSDAIPALIRGLNKAAKIDYSCPAVTIAKKLSRLLGASRDTELLEFARENIGAGIERSQHMGVLKELRFQCLMRKRAVVQSGSAVLRSAPTLKGDSTPRLDPERKALRDLTITQLVEAGGKERGPKLKMVLTELGQRRGDKVIGALGSAAATYDGDVQKLARQLLDRQLSRLKIADIKIKLKDDRAEVRSAAARVVADQGLHLEQELVDLLTDDEATVRRAAHDSLVKLNKGSDYGPKLGASDDEWKLAAQKWRVWLEQQHDR